MTLVTNQLETLDFVTATAVATNVSTEGTVATTDVVNASTYYQSQQGGNPQVVRPVIVEANLNVTAGAGTTAVVIRCKQGVGTGGTQVGLSQTITLAATNSDQFHLKFRDSSGVPFSGAGTAYTITIQQTGGTGAGTVNTVDIEVKQ